MVAARLHTYQSLGDFSTLPMTIHNAIKLFIFTIPVMFIFKFASQNSHIVNH
jgi:hypothetical protein